jgi:3-hydroxyisobutyrate dehydrogenase-like beta-hydroxyacid dehydrogenase
MTAAGTPSTGAVGLIGLGLMGSAIADRLLAAGFSVLGWDISKPQRDALEKQGGAAAQHERQVFEEQDFMLLSLPTHEIVGQLLKGVTGCLRPGQVIIGTSTGDQLVAMQIAESLTNREVGYPDATISCSSEQKRGDLAVMLIGAPGMGAQDPIR